MTIKNMRRRINKLASESAARQAGFADDGYRRLRETIAAAFGGLDPTGLWRTPKCLVLLWLQRVVSRTATSDETALFERISAERFFCNDAFGTAAFLRAIVQIEEDF